MKLVGVVSRLSAVIPQRQAVDHWQSYVLEICFAGKESRQKSWDHAERVVNELKLNVWAVEVQQNFGQPTPNFASYKLKRNWPWHSTIDVSGPFSWTVCRSFGIGHTSFTLSAERILTIYRVSQKYLRNILSHKHYVKILKKSNIFRSDYGSLKVFNICIITRELHGG